MKLRSIARALIAATAVLWVPDASDTAVGTKGVPKP